MSLREQLTALYPDSPVRVQMLMNEYNELTQVNPSWRIGTFIQLLKGEYTQSQSPSEGSNQ